MRAIPGSNHQSKLRRQNFVRTELHIADKVLIEKLMDLV